MSKTIENLKAAFAGESQARNKYTYFAEVARKEGYHYIAKLFDETADNERRHAKDEFLMLGGLSDTAANLKEFEARRAEYERQQEEVLAVARSRAEGLEGLVVAIERKAGEEGKLFGSVGAGDVAEAITAAGVEVQRAEVRLPEPVLRQVGDYEVTIALHARAHAKVTVQVVAG